MPPTWRCMGPQGFRRGRRSDPRPQPLRGRADRRAPRRATALRRRASSRSSSSTSAAPGARSPRSTVRCASVGIFGGNDLSATFPELGQSALVLRHRDSHAGGHRPLRRSSRRSDGRMSGLRRYHAAVWDEPLVHGARPAGRRGLEVAPLEPELRRAVGDPSMLVPSAMRRAAPPELPELSEPEVLRHYLHLSQETLGMMGISLFGTCTMKYNPRLSEAICARPVRRRAPPPPGRGDAAGCARGDLHGSRPCPVRALGDGSVRLPGRRRGRRGLHARLHHPCLPRRAGNACRTRRDHHDDPGASLQCRRLRQPPASR